MNLWPVMVLAGLATFAIRLSFILLIGVHKPPELVQRALRFVPPAVLTAIFVPELFLPGGQLDVSLGNARLVAGVLAILVAWRTRNIFLTILVGMGVLWLLQFGFF
jgi:branched-subunit amino acid transport protein